ncbi:MAG: hypothetical protein H6Q07_292, partial [Acidobacteria bacterium]|nr:hypothetical protein [Acidobacteriota bacterium]
ALLQYMSFCADGSPEPSDRDLCSAESGLNARTGRVWRPVRTGDADCRTAANGPAYCLKRAARLFLLGREYADFHAPVEYLVVRIV